MTTDRVLAMCFAAFCIGMAFAVAGIGHAVFVATPPHVIIGLFLLAISLAFATVGGALIADLLQGKRWHL